MSERSERTIDGTVIAGVELGGTKGVAVLARDGVIYERLRVPTSDPATTLTAMSDRLGEWRDHGHEPAAIGIGSFGPVGVDPGRDDYGSITTTPKAGWRDTDVLGHFEARFEVPIGFDSDVVGAALAEGRWGASRGCSTHVYLTVGTGVGGGVVIDGRPVHGLVHPEIGHVRVRRRSDDDFAGVCPYHGDCIEGIVSGPALAARTGISGEKIDADHPVWTDVADELAELMSTLVFAVSPERIVIGGGVANGNAFLLDAVRARTVELLAGYVAAIDTESVADLIGPPALGDDAGPLGAVAIGLDALDGLHARRALDGQ